MIFNKKYNEKILELENSNYLLEVKNNELRDHKKNIMKNISLIINSNLDSLKHIEFYEVKGNIFLLALFNEKETIFISNIKVQIYIINKEKYKKITDLNSKLYSYKEKSMEDIRILSLDTYEFYNQGHASRSIKLLTNYAKRLQVKKISGGLFLGNKETDEKLREFYAKNGFKVGEFGFQLIL